MPAVLKTAKPKGFLGSNPSSSARSIGWVVESAELEPQYRCKPISSSNLEYSARLVGRVGLRQQFAKLSNLEISSRCSNHLPTAIRDDVVGNMLDSDSSHLGSNPSPLAMRRARAGLLGPFRKRVWRNPPLVRIQPSQPRSVV